MTLLQDALLAALAAAAAVWSLIRVRRLAAIGAAYKAKVLCTIVFGTGRAVSSPSIDEVSADSYRLMRLFRVDIDRRARTVTASLPGFASRRAIFRAPALLYPGKWCLRKILATQPGCVAGKTRNG